MRKIWKSREPDMELSRQLASELEVPLLIAQLLVNRGITTTTAARQFLQPSLSDLHAPSKMIGISDAVDRIKRAIDGGEKIWLYGDYDVDGITSVSLLMPCLRKMGAQVDYYIPHRLDEGYGLSKDGVADLKEKGCSLLITVDCGISAVEEVRMANEAGIDVIVTDHHEPRDELPDAFVTLNPKLESCKYPFDKLAGVGVAFKLAQELTGHEGGRNKTLLQDQLDLVALGTIADVVPLIGENRVIARFGLEVLNKMERIGVRALCEVSSVEEGAVSSGSVGFRLGPRINAAGRLDTAHSAVRLLTTDSYEEALEIAKKLDAANRERQGIEREILDAARKQLQKFDLAEEKGLVLAEEGWHPGVVGIVASRLLDQYYRPTIMITLEDDQGRGSARSIPEFDIFHALSQCAHLLGRFGGHKAAAGLSIARENIGKFRKEFSRIVAETLEPDDLKPKVLIDAYTTLSDLTLETVDQLSVLEPHGLGNPRPLLALRDLSMKGIPRTVGKTGEHLQMMVSDGQRWLRGIGFNKAEMEQELYAQDAKIDLVCRPSINAWQDTRSVELRIEEILVHHEEMPDVMAASAGIMELSQLRMVDRRNIPDKRRHIRRLLGMNEKSLLYVRDDMAVDQLHKIVSEYAARTRLGLCYHETSAGERDKIKQGLIDGELDAVASCVPFEEPLPGLKHLVFCHPVPTREQFARCCTPAVETEELVYVHLIFGARDVDFLTATLSYHYPDRKTLANVYRKMRELSISKNNASVTVEEIAENMDMDGPKDVIVSSCIDVFGEIELVEARQVNGKNTISFPLAPQGRRELQESHRYATGEKIKSEWSQFSDFILKKTAEEIRRMLLEMIP